MAAFKFRLAAVLNLRMRVKDEKQWDLRQLNEERRAMTEAMAALERKIEQAEKVLAGREGMILSAQEHKSHSDHVQLLDQRLKEKRIAAVQLDERIVEKRGELVEAMRGVKALERLRERQAGKFRREQDAAEQKFVDEVAQRKFVSGGGRQKIP
jgi:flagellar export protein FliJ